MENNPTCGLSQMNDTRLSRLTNPTDRQIPPMKTKTSTALRSRPPVFLPDAAAVRDGFPGIRRVFVRPVEDQFSGHSEGSRVLVGLDPGTAVRAQNGGRDGTVLGYGGLAGYPL